MRLTTQFSAILTTLSLAGLLLAACKSGGESSTATPAPMPTVEVDEDSVLLSPSEQLLRVSMAIRGTRPSLEDIEEITADPGVLEGKVDEYLDSQDFGATIRDLYNEALKLRVPPAIFPAGFAATGVLSGETLQRINVSVTEAPLRLIEKIVLDDLPLTEIVTADHVMADGMVAQVWGLPYTGNGTSWEETRYEDGRPHAGILSDSWLYTRHSSTFSNKNRGRANAIARGLLCHDYTERHVELDATIDLSDPQQVANAIEANPSCASCHQTLDPLAAFFGSYYPLFVPSFLTAYPFEGYAPELSPLFTVKDPGYFGYPGGDAQHLGQMIAEDPRFAVCQAKRFYSYFTQVPLNQVPQEVISQLTPVLTEHWNAKELVKAIVLDPHFLVSHRTRDDEPEDAPTMLKARPWQLASAVADLTGFRWQSSIDFNLGYGPIGGVDLMTDALFGFEVISGGIDSVNVALPSHTMTATANVVLRGLAERAAEHVVDSDAQYPDSAKLFRDLTPSETDETAVRSQLVSLHAAIFALDVASDSPEVDDAYQLFAQALTASGDAERAWKLTISALLQHPRMAFY